MIRLKAILIGLGNIGCGYDLELPYQCDRPRSSLRTLTHARALVCHPGFELLAGVDSNVFARERFSQRYALPAHANLHACFSALNGDNPDLVVIAVSPLLQPFLVESVLDLMSPRMLLLEKPLAVNLENARALLSRCTRQKEVPIVAVNYIRRYLPAVLSWQQRLQVGELGRLLHGQITYGKGLLNNGSHFVNLVEAWLGSLRFSKLLNSGRCSSDFDCEACLELQAEDHEDAPVMVRSVGSVGLRAGEVDLWFEGGRLCWCNNGKNIAFWPRSTPSDGDSFASLEDQPYLVSTGIDHYQLEVLDSLYNVARDPSLSLACSAASALKTLQSIEPAINP